jgi:molecular chaperone GrpE
MSTREKKKKKRGDKNDSDETVHDAPILDGPGSGAEDAPAKEAPEPLTLEEEVLQLRDKWLRAKAESDNVRKMAAQDVADSRRYGASGTLLGLLDVLDNLQRALAAPPEGVEETFLTGLRLIEQQFVGVLEAHGVTPVKVEKGMPLDPMLHRALLEQPSDEVEPGRILVVAVGGYKLHDRLLREAQVVVARAPDEPTDEPAAQD